MNRRNFFSTLLAIAALFIVGSIANVGNAHAQSLPPGPCPVFWVNYNYVYPPAPNGALTVEIECADGRIIARTNETADGHYTYPADPTCAPVGVWIEYIDPGTGLPVRIRVPITPGTVQVVNTPWGPLRVEGKFDKNGCFELDLSY